MKQKRDRDRDFTRIKDEEQRDEEQRDEEQRDEEQRGERAVTFSFI